ncbi:uncharacterized protein LOC109721013 isoform X2 [Ananas comosus]|uniref:Uncharacterized protein LOC109721013 isoform X2 n=1 Tax=Ananas comosus TaxID=4615 RepID=A0A6P5G851_ANACO|nr:uncharacterized protein LOC109721013 isoform X2 [Ananas comosus]
MKEGADLLPTSAAKASSGGGAAASEAALLGKGRYKFWALAAIVLLAFWSMLTGTVTLKWSAGDLARFSDDLDRPLHDDLDVLEMEEREKMVRHMWDVYAHSERIRLPRFWQEAFEAAYEELAGDDARVRDDAVAEIARMSLRMVDLEPPPRHRRHGPKNAVIVLHGIGPGGDSHLLG